MYVSMYVYVYVYMYVCTCMYVYVYVCMYVYLYNVLYFISMNQSLKFCKKKFVLSINIFNICKLIRSSFHLFSKEQKKSYLLPVTVSLSPGQKVCAWGNSETFLICILGRIKCQISLFVLHFVMFAL